MARTTARPPAASEQELVARITRCPECGEPMWSAYMSERTICTLEGLRKFRLQVRRCRNIQCRSYRRPYRPEEEGRLALPQHEFGLDVIALVGSLRYQGHRSVPEIHRELVGRGLSVCERTVTNLLDRYDELLAVRLSDSRRLRQITSAQGRVLLGLDGLQPDVGHEVLWVLRDCLSGEVLLARSLLSSTEADLAGLIREVKEALSVPIVGVISDGQHSIRNAVAAVLPGVPHQLCQFHYLREAARPIYETDRHAKKELKKRVRDIRPIERQVEPQAAGGDEQARAVLGYCSAVRSAITDDGRPPLESSGLKLQERLSAVAASLAKVEEKRGCRRNCKSSGESSTAGLRKRRRCGRR
jgi:hypothetical protein